MRVAPSARIPANKLGVRVIDLAVARIAHALAGKPVRVFVDGLHNEKLYFPCAPHW